MTSWFKVTQRRVKETILQSVGAHDKTEDQEFDEKCAKFTLFYHDLTKVHLSMQLWLDSIDLLCGSWVGMGESLNKFCTTGSDSENSPLSDIIKCFSLIGNDVNSVLKGVIKSIFIDRCMKPIESILAIVPIINQKIQERRNLLLDVGFYNSKKQSEKNSGKDDNHPNVIKLTNKLNESERLLHNLTGDIDSCIDQLCSARSYMLGPEIAALISCMESFPLIISQKVGQMTPLIPQTASTTCLLLASIETAEINLKSNGLVETLQSNITSFPIQPTLRRTGAMGGTTGGYGHAGFMEGLMSTVDLLLKSAEPSYSRNSGNIDDITRDSMAISRESQSVRILSSSSSSTSNSGSDLSYGRSSSPSPNMNNNNNQPNRPITSSKRPVIKLGSDRPISSKNMQPQFSETTTNTSTTSTNTLNTINESSTSSSTTSRPLSLLKPSYPPPKPPKDDGVDSGESNNNSNNNKRTPSKRLTGSALLLSGRPRDLLGASPSSSMGLNDSYIEEVPEESMDGDRWSASNGKFYSDIISIYFLSFHPSICLCIHFLVIN